MHETESLASLWPMLVYGCGVVLLVTFMLTLSYFLGEKHKETVTDTEFESGIKVTGNARYRFNVQFYIVAMFFVVFDLEIVFIVAWAINAKELGWPGYISIVTFIGSLVAVLIYVWRIGALDFGPSGKKILKMYNRYHKVESGQIIKELPIENKTATT